MAVTIPVYPPELPPPLRADYQVAQGDGRFKSKSDAGPVNIRGHFSAAPTSVPFSTHLDRTQLARFERFFAIDTKRGALPFLIRDPGSDCCVWLDEDDTPLLYEDGTPILITETWLAMFDSQPSVRANDIYWIASFTLSVLP